MTQSTGSNPLNTLTFTPAQVELIKANYMAWQDDEITRLRAEIAERDKEIERLQKENDDRRVYISLQHAGIDDRDAEIERLRADLDRVTHGTWSKEIARLSADLAAERQRSRLPERLIGRLRYARRGEWADNWASVMASTIDDVLAEVGPQAERQHSVVVGNQIHANNEEGIRWCASHEGKEKGNDPEV